MKDHPIVVDIEGYAIESRPKYPPVPTGISIKEFGQPAEYLSWGHVSENNTTFAAAKRRLKEQLKNRDWLMHNASFDCDVIETHLGVKMPEWNRIHDTMWLLFLHNPNLKNLGLKPSSEEILGWPSDEQDAVADYLCSTQPVDGVRISRGKQSATYYMKYIPWCPGDIIGSYARGDVERTEALFEKLHPSIIQRGMSEAYDRERRLMPVLLDMERRGVRVDLDRLCQDVSTYQVAQQKIDEWLRKKLGVNPFFNLDSDAFVEALLSAGLADQALLGVTESGKIATNKDAIARGVTDKQVAAVLQYRAQLHTCLDTFLVTWLKMAEESNGLIYTTWNQVRGEGRGARTGRLSSSPNFQNIPKSFNPLFAHEKKGLPPSPIRGLPPLPKIRSYVIPYEKDHVLIDRDWNQQELRIMAHFGDGALLERYKENIWLDMHDTVKEDLLRMANMDVPRDSVKTVNFGIIYGMGVGELARRTDQTEADARALKKTIVNLYPEIGDLYSTTRALARANEPLWTWGGRENYCEPPTRDKKTGALIDWSYKMVNTMVQGSAGDAIKESMIRLQDAAPKDHHILLQVHDQICSSVPRDQIVKGHRIMREAMESLQFDVPMLSEGKWSATNWAELQPFDKRGIQVAVGLPEQRGK